MLSIRLLLVVELHDVVHLRAPLLQLSLPVHLHCGGHHDEHLRDLLCLEQSFAKGCNLYCFAETHVVAEHAALFVAIHFVQPDDSFLLVLKEPLVDFGWQTKVVLKYVLAFFRIELKTALFLSLGQRKFKVRIFIFVAFLYHLLFLCRRLL